MKNLEDKIQKIQTNNKALAKRIEKDAHYTIERFIKDTEDYIKAIAERKMICTIPHVANSGMSRTIKFVSFDRVKGQKEGYIRNYFAFFTALGFREARNGDGFTIGGCGMDLVFHTNYTIIHRLHNIGLVSKKQCERLAQKTPTVI